MPAATSLRAATRVSAGSEGPRQPSGPCTRRLAILDQQRAGEFDTGDPTPATRTPSANSTSSAPAGGSSDATAGELAHQSCSLLASASVDLIEVRRRRCAGRARVRRRRPGRDRYTTRGGLGRPAASCWRWRAAATARVARCGDEHSGGPAGHARAKRDGSGHGAPCVAARRGRSRSAAAHTFIDLRGSVPGIIVLSLLYYSDK